MRGSRVGLDPSHCEHSTYRTVLPPKIWVALPLWKVALDCSCKEISHSSVCLRRTRCAEDEGRVRRMEKRNCSTRLTLLLEKPCLSSLQHKADYQQCSTSLLIPLPIHFKESLTLQSSLPAWGTKSLLLQLTVLVNHALLCQEIPGW